MKYFQKIYYIFFLFLFNVQFVHSQKLYLEADSVFLKEFLKSTVKFPDIINNPSKYRVQIIYTQITHNKSLPPILKHYVYRYEAQEYFYPASIVKLPLSIFALERINTLSAKGVNMYTRFINNCLNKCQIENNYDKYLKYSVPCIANFIKLALVVSDNTAYNQLYEFNGQEPINSRLAELGYSNARIVHRFSDCSTEMNKQTSGFTFYNSKEEVICVLPSLVNDVKYSSPVTNRNIGKQYVDGNNKIVNDPKNFDNKNYLPLDNIHDILIRLCFPNLYPKEKRFNITNDERNFLMTQLLISPKQSDISEINNNMHYYDSYANYFFYGSEKSNSIKKEIKVYNIVGKSYGFLIDCAYIVNKAKGIEFFLTACIYVNSNEIVNDNVYEYNSIGLPFLKKLGWDIYKYELSLKPN